MTTYIIKSGDTMWQIANKYGISLNQLIKANPQITNLSLIFPGQTINIPSTTNTSSTYIVKQGDSMWQIATKHGIGLSALIAANPQITDSSLIYPGQKINIPSAFNEPTTPTTSTTPSVPDDIKALETEVIRLVNVERSKAGVPALSTNNKLSDVARIKSRDFVNNNYFSHNSPTYGSPFDMIKSFGISYTSAAENLASGHRSAAEAMNSWMNSSGHRTNILNPTYNQIGVGVARDSKGNLYWTQMFIRI